MTATRCAIGVTPPCPAAVAGTFVVAVTAAFFCCAPREHAASASRISSGAEAFFTLIRESRARSRPSKQA